MITGKRTNLIWILFIGIALSSCDPNRVYEKNIDIPDYIWDADNKLVFDVEIKDTVSSHNIFVNVRHASHYQYSNLFLFINTTAPSGAAIRDTFECWLADPTGKWYGEGLGDIWDNKIPFKKNVRFPLSGIYTFEIEQAMRNEKLPFIMDAGIRIERIN